MNDDIVLSFTIALSFIGIIISISSLVVAIIFLVKASKLEKVERHINEIKKALISQLILFSENNEVLKGQEVLELIKKEYNCDDYTALLIYNKTNSTVSGGESHQN